MYHAEVVGRCPCECEEFNFYKFPPPLKRERSRLDAIELTIHSDEFIWRELVKKGCCPPECVIKKVEKKSFIITAVTRCLEPGVYYTLQIDRETPEEAYPLDTFINVESCEKHFNRGKIELKFTKTIHGGCYGEGHEAVDEFHEERFHEGREMMREVGEEMGVDGRVFETVEKLPIPANPAFPGQNFIGCGFKGDGTLVPVKLDLLGDIANGKNFSTGRYKVPGTGPSYSNRFVLFRNNSNEFVLNRNWLRRSDFA